jgi:hypothetical protein
MSSLLLGASESFILDFPFVVGLVPVQARSSTRFSILKLKTPLAQLSKNDEQTTIPAAVPFRQS